MPGCSANFTYIPVNHSPAMLLARPAIINPVNYCEHLLEREMPLSLCITLRGMVFILLLGHRMCQLIVATNILEALAMLQHHPLVIKSMEVGYSPLSV